MKRKVSICTLCGRTAQGATDYLERKIGIYAENPAVEDFGDGTVIVSEYPVILEGADIAAQLTEIAGYLADNVREVTTEKLDWIFHSAACRAAVKAGDVTTDYELQQFAERVLSMPDIRYCPHGRPVLAGFTRRDIERLFGRV